jgi:hypothetical protein
MTVRGRKSGRIKMIGRKKLKGTNKERKVERRENEEAEIERVISMSV